MPVPIQQGGVADRLRNYLRLVGRAGTTMDEILVPTVNVQSLDQPPYRTQERRWMAFADHAAVALNNGHCGISMPANVGGVCVVDKIIIVNPTASTLEYSLISIDNPSLGLANYAEDSVLNVENWNGAPGGTAAQLPPLVYTGEAVGGSFPILGRVRVLPDEMAILDVSISLRSGLGGVPANVRALSVQNTSINFDTRVSFMGDFHPSAT